MSLWRGSGGRPMATRRACRPARHTRRIRLASLGACPPPEPLILISLSTRSKGWCSKSSPSANGERGEGQHQGFGSSSADRSFGTIWPAGQGTSSQVAATVAASGRARIVRNTAAISRCDSGCWAPAPAGCGEVHPARAVRLVKSLKAENRQLREDVEILRGRQPPSHGELDPGGGRGRDRSPRRRRGARPGPVDQSRHDQPDPGELALPQVGEEPRQNTPSSEWPRSRPSTSPAAVGGDPVATTTSITTTCEVALRTCS